jgi:hypothetical protein
MYPTRMYPTKTQIKTSARTLALQCRDGYGIRRRSNRVITTGGAILMALGIICGASRESRAQDVANGLATANVQATLAVIATQNLQFGNMFQGVAKSIGNNVDAFSGIFNITGAPSAGLSISMVMPDYMALADGSDRMTIAFSPTDATIDTNNTTPSTVGGGDGWQNVNPRNVPAAVVVGSGGQTNIYIGGRAIPAVNQKAGAYTGDLIVSVAYDGT